ncbi:MAG TPA: hypothetical protein VK961_08760 [Chthoniobacter sp.]|nr:hypothetical protein [Chthoniobacter sp.]
MTPRLPQLPISGRARSALAVLSSLGFTGGVAVTDLWIRRTQDDVRGTFAPVIPSHGAGLYRLRAR